MSNGPSNPISKPPGRNSFCLIRPVLKAMALGGVDTGSSKAVSRQTDNNANCSHVRHQKNTQRNEYGGRCRIAHDITE